MLLMDINYDDGGYSIFKKINHSLQPFGLEDTHLGSKVSLDHWFGLISMYFSFLEMDKNRRGGGRWGWRDGAATMSWWAGSTIRKSIPRISKWVPETQGNIPFSYSQASFPANTFIRACHTANLNLPSFESSLKYILRCFEPTNIQINKSRIYLKCSEFRVHFHWRIFSVFPEYLLCAGSGLQSRPHINEQKALLGGRSWHFLEYTLRLP